MVIALPRDSGLTPPNNFKFALKQIVMDFSDTAVKEEVFKRAPLIAFPYSVNGKVLFNIFIASPKSGNAAKCRNMKHRILTFTAREWN